MDGGGNGTNLSSQPYALVNEVRATGCNKNSVYEHRMMNAIRNIVNDIGPLVIGVGSEAAYVAMTDVPS